MSAVILNRKDLEKLGRKVMKDLFGLSDDSSLREKKDEILKSLVYYKFEFFSEHVCGVKYNESRFEKDLEQITNSIKEEKLDLKLIYDSLSSIEFNLKSYVSEYPDVFDDINAFLKIYEVYKFYSRYLER